MMFATKLCKEIGCKMRAWSGGVCKNHTPKKAIPSTPKPVNNNDRILKMQEFFLSIWKKRPHKSEVSGTSLGSEALSVYFHHILPKEKYPEACFDEENIILLTLLEHADVESDMYRFEEVNRRRTLLLVKYGKI
jgi:hypothetical protein